MEYITVYVTTDEREITVLKSLFESNNLDFKISGKKDAATTQEQYVQVAEKDRKEARILLRESGYLNIEHSYREPSASSGKKWMFIFLAALVLILVAVLIGWFMTAP